MPSNCWMLRILAATAWFCCSVPWVVNAEEPTTFDAASLEFFEKEVRPILAQRCLECHSGKLEEPKGGLRLDTRAYSLQGGETGPAVVPGKPKESLLIDAINYGDFQMPPKSRMPANEIAVLTKWIEMGAPWPQEKLAGDDKKAKPFSLAERKASHWCWQPIQSPQPPVVKNSGWVKSPIDAFVLAKLEEKELAPNAAADKRVLIRRAYFDLIGLPPTPEQVAAFLQDESPDAFAKVVDELLKSPHFGERWGRHWLDLMRYAESRGHEFDYDIPNAWEYRDYVIRALNADVPYDQFVTEHIAGDLLPNPRLHPTEKFNESIIGTGFWFLGEWVHSPVDIRKDECDRFDNMVDVFSKSFLAMTVSCARCHDHKFDAISQKDYYALFGYLQSSDYRQARVAGETHNRDIAGKLAKLSEQTQEKIGELIGDCDGQEAVLGQLPEYLLAARQAILAGGSQQSREPIAAAATAAKLDPATLTTWVDELGRAHGNPQHPLHFWALVCHDKEADNPEKLAAIARPFHTAKQLRDERLQKEWQQATIVCDYRQANTPWIVDGPGFGTAPVKTSSLRLARNKSEPFLAEIATQTAATFDRTWSGLKNSAGVQNDSGAIGGWDRLGKTLRTPTFEVTHGQVQHLVQGAGRAFVVIDSHRLLHGPLHGQSLKEWNDDETGEPRWITQDLSAYIGHRVHVEFSPKGDADLRVVMVAVGQPPREPLPNQVDLAPQLIASTLEKTAKAVANTITAAVADEEPPPGSGPLARWAWQHPQCFFTARTLPIWEKGLAKLAHEYQAARDEIVSQIAWESRTAPAMIDGSGDDERLLVRGSHNAPRDTVPRRFLSAIAGEEAAQIEHGSGRLALAQQVLAENNPLTARVMVNRLWHHLLGRGIVPSVDNFGVLGQTPSHPELLDYLATEFRREGWSTKRLIRAIMLSNTYQMTSTPGPADVESDPQNILLHRANIRRLESEVIRDQMLLLSGRLNDKQFGPPVPVFLTQYMQGRGRPGSGPLDGDGRRSIYVSIRRNFLSPMMLAFDTPSPFSTMGKRNISNVPAQALTLMNDPFVVAQASLWGQRLLNDKSLTTADARIARMYQQAFARDVTSEETRAAIAFLESQGSHYGLSAEAAQHDPRIWGDLCHVMMNVKEFIFIP